MGDLINSPTTPLDPSSLTAASSAFVPEQTSSAFLAASSAAAANGDAGPFAQAGAMNNASGLQYDYYVEEQLNSTMTGCYANGSLPVPLANQSLCLDGWYCPNSTDQAPPQYCPPTQQCQALRMTKGTCDPQGMLEPVPCQRGHYCPQPGKLQLQCPAGTFCPQGSYIPLDCAYGAICPPGSSRQITTLPLAAVAAIDVALAVVVAIGFAISRWRKARPKMYTTLDLMDPHSEDIELLPAAGKPGHLPSPRLSVSSPTDTHPRDLQRPIVNQARMTQVSRISERIDRTQSYADDDNMSSYDDLDDMDDDLHNSPDMQRYIRSLSRTIETSSIGLSFDFEGLGFETKKGKKILQDITGTMPRGSCWGIMGGSGAGKSTLVNVLMGKSHATTGTLKINGWSKEMSKYKKLIGYVPQDDIVLPELTVRENILHSARIRMPATWRDKAIQDHVDALIACLQLEHVQHSRVGDANKPVISGGQRKRVNLGMELAAAPMAVFLDEPTSGLDATSAASVMRLLRAVSRLGVTVIAIIHQPREQIFYGFDQLLLLSRGRSVYSGPTEDVRSYFESLGFAFPQRANPADTLIDIITGDGAQYNVGAGKRETEVDALISDWKLRGQYKAHGRHLSVGLDGTQAKRDRRTSNSSMHSTAEQEEDLQRTMKARGATWPAQAYYCWKRAMTQQVRNSTSFFFEIGVGGLAGVIIGLSAFAAEGHLFQGIYKEPFSILSSAIDYQDIPQLGLLGGMAIGLAASAPGFWTFGEEKLMYRREAASGHSRSAYFVGKLLSTVPRIALSALHFTAFLGILATPLESFQRMYAANLMYFWCVYGLAHIVSMVVKREDGPLIAVLASLVIGVMGGVAPPLRKVRHWHMEWLWRSSPGVWFTESYFSENLMPLGYLYELDLAAKTTGFTLGQYGLDIGMLFVIGVIYRLVAFLGLVLVKR